MPKAIIYTRVSSERQVEEGHSLDSQDRICRQYAQDKGLELIRNPFVEKGESAKTTDRTQLKLMLKYIGEHKNEIDALIVYKVDRLSRDTSDYLAIKQALSRAGITILSVSENFENTPIGRVMETVASSFAQYDNEIRAERSRNGMLEAVRSGRFPHKAPFGFINTKVNGNKNITPNPKKGLKEIIRNSWVMIDNGCSLSETFEQTNKNLTALGYKKIINQSFSKMVHNPIYKGVIKDFGLEIHSKTIKPIVEAELFDRVQLILQKNKNKGNKYSKINPQYPLRGILWCVNGHKMTASSPRGNGGVYPKYHCPKCKGLGVSYDVNQTSIKFSDYAKNFKIKDELREALKEAIKLNLDDTQKQNTKINKNLEKQIVTIKAEKKEIAHNLIKGVIPEKTAQELLSDYEQQETEIKLKLNQLNNDVEDVEELIEFGIKN